MKSVEVRKKYLDFFQKRGHKIIPSALLIPENDPTTLFTSSGMQPLVPYLLGQQHPLGKRLTNSQKSFRAEDIEEVGDNRHTTFFEMLGNWSLGDYFKTEQLSWFFEFLTKEIGLDPKQLYVTVFSGAPEFNISRDEESINIWKEIFKKVGVDSLVVDIITEKQGGELGMQGGRIFTYNAKKNWWSRSGVPEKMPVGEIGGPDSEVFYEFSHVKHDSSFGKYCHPNCDCGRFIEIGNSVFMQYKKNADGFEELPARNVDFGGGLERIVAASTDFADIFKTDLFWPTIELLEKKSDLKYEKENTKPMRVIIDHMRAACFMLADGIVPSNSEQGYILRRLIRRMIRFSDVLKISERSLSEIVDSVIEPFKNIYDNLLLCRDLIIQEINKEELRFRETLTRGMKHFNELTGQIISGKDAFVLFTTYGFPVEVTQELAKEKGMNVNMQEYEVAMKEHQSLSRVGAEQKFKGGLADHKEQTVRYHTAHHILLRALQIVLGNGVHQRGSNITSERLRIDFSSPGKMTLEQIKETEKIVNEKIIEGLPVLRTVMKQEEAENLGAEHEFGVKYPEMVSIYSIGPKNASQDNPDFGNSFSIEFCGGPHVKNTSELGHFKIVKEEASSAGIRRIKAILE